MTNTRALLMTLFIIMVCFTVALPGLWVELFPTWIGALVLTSIFGFVFLLSLLAAKWLSGGRRAEYAARLQQRQGSFVWACALATVGIPLFHAGNGVAEIAGLVIFFAGLCVALWAILSASPARSNENSPDGGLYQI